MYKSGRRESDEDAVTFKCVIVLGILSSRCCQASFVFDVRSRMFMQYDATLGLALGGR